jgi:hypothetical protein
MKTTILVVQIPTGEFAASFAWRLETLFVSVGRRKHICWLGICWCIYRTPGTSDFVGAQGGSNDELHVIVLDEDGKLLVHKVQFLKNMPLFLRHLTQRRLMVLQTTTEM